MKAGGVILGLDPATRKIGWCAGDGATLPAAGALLLDQHEEQIGAMLVQFDKKLRALIADWRPEVIIFEAPILPRPGKPGQGGAVLGSLMQRRKQFAIYSHIEFICADLSIACVEADLKALKKEVGGAAHASKADMVYVAQKIGIELPAQVSKGREDAADAAAAWLLGVRHYAKVYARDWDIKLYRARGALI